MGERPQPERREAVLPVAALIWSEAVRDGCRPCPRHGRNFACPPHSPRFDAYVDGAASARVICLRLPVAAFPGGDGDQKYRAGFREASRRLAEELLAHRRQRFTVAGCGPCLACEPCAAEQGSPGCVRPAERVYSLESLGVDVVALVQRCFGWELTWGNEEHPDARVAAVGAVFYPGGAAVALPGSGPRSPRQGKLRPPRP